LDRTKNVTLAIQELSVIEQLKTFSKPNVPVTNEPVVVPENKEPPKSNVELKTVPKATLQASKPRYDLGETIVINYTLVGEIKTDKYDWIGIYSSTTQKKQ